MKHRLYKAVQFSVHSPTNATSRYRSEIKDLLSVTFTFDFVSLLKLTLHSCWTAEQKLYMYTGVLHVSRLRWAFLTVDQWCHVIRPPLFA